VPADALLLESDEHTADGAAAALAEACARVAHARGWSEADAAARTAANARQAFNVDAWAL
jgi:Tat protein secretion system quality control protein TatD with DNase activity